MNLGFDKLNFFIYLGIMVSCVHCGKSESECRCVVIYFEADGGNSCLWCGFSCGFKIFCSQLCEQSYSQWAPVLRASVGVEPGGASGGSP